MSNLSQFIGGGKLCTQEFLASGTFTPSTRLLALGGKVMVEMVGGGASGGVRWSTSASDTDAGVPGGDAGQYVETIVTVTGPVGVTIGAGGARASVSYGASAVGNPGSDTTFGSLVTAKGGICGQIMAGSIPVAKGGAGALSIGGSARNATGVLTDPMGGKGINGRAGGGAAASTVTATAGTSRATDGGGDGMLVASTVTANVVGNSAAANSGAGGGGVVCQQASAAFTVSSGAGANGWLRATWFE